MVAAAVGIGGAVSGIGGIFGSSISASAQQQAAQTEAAATQAAIQAEQTQFNTGLGYTSPYATFGTGAEEELLGEMGILPGESYAGQNFSGSGGPLGSVPNISDPSQLPGFDFTLKQGLNATNNAATATGTAAVPGSGNYSGAQNKADIGYAENLASTYYGNFLQNYWANQNNRFNQLAQLTNYGLGAATIIQGNAVTAGGQEGTTGISGATAANNFNVGGANTLAAGITGAGNSLSSNLLLASALGNTGSTINYAQPTATYAGGNADYGGGGPAGTAAYGTA